jgi:hypothetical protein
LSYKVTESKQALQDAVDAGNPILGGVQAAASIGTSRRIGGSSMGKKKRMNDKWRR